MADSNYSKIRLALGVILVPLITLPIAGVIYSIEIYLTLDLSSTIDPKLLAGHLSQYLVGFLLSSFLLIIFIQTPICLLLLRKNPPRPFCTVLLVFTLTFWMLDGLGGLYYLSQWTGPYDAAFGEALFSYVIMSIQLVVKGGVEGLLFFFIVFGFRHKVGVKPQLNNTESSELFAKFVEKWIGDYHKPKPATETQLQSIEERFKISLPASYKEYMTSYGETSSTCHLLNSIVELEADLNDISDFFSTDGIIENTDGWRPLGLPHKFVAFAGDGMGNLFCFYQEDSAVWFFDHDFQDMEKIASSFVELIEMTYNLEFIPDEDFV